MSEGTRVRAILLAIVAVALLLRIVPTYAEVFAPGWVNLQDGDAWYHLRLIESQVRNFPHRLLTDPYLADGGALVAIGPFFDFVVAMLAWTTGLGAPSPHHIAVVAALVPPIMAAGVVVIVFLVGRRVFGVPAGLIAAALAAVMPGHFLDRTRLGFVDHHAAEVLLAMLTLHALIGEAAPARRRDAAAGTWSVEGGYALLAGLAWGAYLVTWTSGAMLSFMLCAWVVLHGVVALVRQRDASPAPRTVLVASLVAFVVLTLVEPVDAWRFGSRLVSVIAAFATAAGMMAVQAAARRLRPTPVVAGAAVTGLALVAGLLFVREFGEQAAALARDLGRLSPRVAARTVGEVQPLLLLSGSLSLWPAWALFGAPFFVGAAATVPLAWRVAWRAAPDTALVLVFAVGLLAATLGQNRFGYYLVPLMALLTGWVAATVIGWATRRDLRALGAGRRPLWRPAAIAGVLLVFVSFAAATWATARHATGLSAEWRAVLAFLRDATPDPFGDPGVYEHPFPRFEPLTRRPSYTVMAWWDFGYPIVQIARRVPVAVATQAGAVPASWFLGTTQVDDAHRLLRATRSRFIVLSDDLLLLPSLRGTTRLQGRFESIMAWGPGDVSRYYETFLERDGEGRLREFVLFHPDYYRTMAARLYLFGGRSVEPRDSTWVVTYRVSSRADGTAVKEIVASRAFALYSEAVAHLQHLGRGPHAIVGRDPMRSCVPLEGLDGFSLLYESADGPARPSSLASIRLFEFRPLATEPPIEVR